MAIKQQTLVFLLGCALLVWYIYAIFTSKKTTQTYTHTHTNAMNQLPAEQDINDSFPALTGERPFLVIVQTESCLTTQLKSEDAFGNSTTCQCDVLVLSYKSECKEVSPTHIQYVFKTNVTWNQGRNLLFEIGRNRSEKYLYYIFMDDDVQLKTELHVNPWLLFLQFLKEIEPAVGIIDFPRNVAHALNARKKLGCATSGNKSTFYINAPNFDSAVNAFHYQAVDHILPYPTKFDNLSWFYSGFYAKVKCDLTFPGQAVQLTKIISDNPVHRPYPRKLPNQHDWNAIMNAVVARLPEKYQNTTELRAWRNGGWRYEDDSPTHCLPIPIPHMPVTPYLHL